MKKWSKVAGCLMMQCLVSDSQAAEAENAFVKVSADTPVYRLEQKGEVDFNAYCSGVNLVNFTVVTNSDCELIIPANGSLEIKPGASGVWQVKSQLREDKPKGRIFLWNYFIEADGYNAKDITVPFGKEVKYFSYEGPNAVNSDWDVSGYEKSKQKSDTDSIIFSRSFWNITEWFTESYPTPKPGVYEIKANLTGKPDVNDTGVMTVVGAEFTENDNHNYGFDDYSNWSLGPTDYYKTGTNRKGHCTLPYASVRAGDQGMAYLTVDPASNTKEIQISSSASESDLALNPATTVATTDFGFTPASSWFPQTATVTAKMDDTPLAKMVVHSYELKHYKCLVVRVGKMLPDGSPFYSKIHGSVQNINPVYRQTVVDFSFDVLLFEYKYGPNGIIWTETDAGKLGTSFFNKCSGIISEYKSVLFMIDGRGAGGVSGWGSSVPGIPFSYIFTQGFEYPYVAPHEIGHNLKLDNIEDNNGDKFNLMFWTAIDDVYLQNKLRKSQWDKIVNN